MAPLRLLSDIRLLGSDGILKWQFLHVYGFIPFNKERNDDCGMRFFITQWGKNVLKSIFLSVLSNLLSDLLSDVLFDELLSEADMSLLSESISISQLSILISWLDNDSSDADLFNNISLCMKLLMCDCILSKSISILLLSKSCKVRIFWLDSDCSDTDSSNISSLCAKLLMCNW